MKKYQEIEIGKFEIYDNIYESSEIINRLLQYITSERKQKFERVLSHRTNHFIPIMDDIYDQGNINAVVRTSENFGFYEIGYVASERINTKTTRINKGADKWIRLNQFSNSIDCIQSYQNRGYQVYATHLDENAKDYREIDLSKPTAIIFGNEKAGVNKKALKACDGTCIIPTVGLTQSFNISVACAIVETHVFQFIESHGEKYLLNKKNRNDLLARYILNTVDNPEILIKHLVKSND